MRLVLATRNAHKLRDKMQAFWPSFVTPVKVGGQEFYRVMLGPWSTREEAQMAQDRMAQSGAKAIMVERP